MIRINIQFQITYFKSPIKERTIESQGFYSSVSTPEFSYFIVLKIIYSTPSLLRYTIPSSIIEEPICRFSVLDFYPITGKFSIKFSLSLLVTHTVNIYIHVHPSPYKKNFCLRSFIKITNGFLRQRSNSIFGLEQRKKGWLVYRINVPLSQRMRKDPSNRFRRESNFLTSYK